MTWAEATERLEPRLNAFEAQLLRQGLQGRTRKAAAEALGISLRTLFYKMRKHGLMGEE